MFTQIIFAHTGKIFAYMGKSKNRKLYHKINTYKFVKPIKIREHVAQ